MKLRGLAALFAAAVGIVALAGASLLAQNEGRDKPKPVKEAPEGYAVKADRAASGGVYPGAIRVRGSAEQSVAAGEVFLMDVFLNDTAPSDTQVTLKAFRLDLSGVGSGDVKVIPIVEGSGSDEKYWAIQPLSPITIPKGYIGLVNIQARVMPNAKQPTAGTATPFKPVEFPDHLIFIAENNNGVHTRTLRVRKP
jgi:hypothetical protein